MNLPPSPVVGREVSLRLAEESDAAAIFRLRADPRLNSHLSPIGGDVESQREWLRDYKRREKKGEEFYYMIVVAGDDCGAVRLYDFSGDSFTWGSLILDVKNPALALESIALAYRIGFESLGFARARFDVRRENRRVLALHRRLGARPVGARGEDVLFEFWPQDYRRLLSRLGLAATAAATVA